MQPIYTQEEIKSIITNTNKNFDVYEFHNEYGKERISSLPAYYVGVNSSIRDAYIENLKKLRQEWIVELQTIGNPFVLYTINKRIVALRTILKEGF